MATPLEIIDTAVKIGLPLALGGGLTLIGTLLERRHRDKAERRKDAQQLLQALVKKLSEIQADHDDLMIWEAKTILQGVQPSSDQGGKIDALKDRLDQHAAAILQQTGVLKLLGLDHASKEMTAWFNAASNVRRAVRGERPPSKKEINDLWDKVLEAYGKTVAELAEAYKKL